jgi:3-dehydroquinate synthase
MDTCHHIWKQLIEHRATRQSLLINLGGGTVCDIGGFAASVFKRGIKFYNVPTTILSMADASIGGKTGIDYDGIKNVIGVFKPAEEIFIIPEFQKTLPVREWKSGFAEITKSALIADKRLWNELQHLKEGSYLKEDFIRRCAEVKQRIVKKDPLEKNVRRLLNFGHTMGHPIESYSLRHHRHPITHGEAVAAGMICAAFLSRKKVKLANDETEKIISFLTSRYGRFNPAFYPAEEIIEIAKHDKKISGKDFNFTLIKKIGVGLINCPISEKEMRWALQQYFRY